jgi:hypothetical protein
MGDYVDGRGNVMPSPGNGRPKRARTDKEGNIVSDNDVYFYETRNTPNTRVSLRDQHTSLQNSAGGATDIDVTNHITEVLSTPTNPLADGVYIGQKKILYSGSAGNKVITPSNTRGTWATITFSAEGQTAHLMWLPTGWAIIGLGPSTTDGGTRGASLPQVS